VFEIVAPIQSPDKCEVRFVIRLLNAEIHKQIVAVYGDLMNRQNVTEWFRELFEGRTEVQDEQRSGKSFLISDDLLEKNKVEILANRRETIRELHHIFPKVSKTTIHEAVTEKFGYRKLCARWVPKILTDNHYCVSGEIQVGCNGPPVLQSGPRAQRFPLVSSPKETSRWENVGRR
jgi:hypothetical protein